MLAPLREAWERHTNFRFTSLANRCFLFNVDCIFENLCVWHLVHLQVCKLKQRMSYRVLIISSCSWFLSGLVLRVAGRFISPASTSSPPSSYRPSSAAASLVVWAPGPPSRVVSSGPAVKQVIPGTGSRAVHASPWLTAMVPIQWLLAVAPGNTSGPRGWGVTSPRWPSLVAPSVAAVVALAGTRWTSLGCRRWNSAQLWLPYRRECNDTTLCWAIIEGRDHAGGARGKWDIDGHVLGRRRILLGMVWWWRWLGLKGRRHKEKEWKSKYK